MKYSVSDIMSMRESIHSMMPDGPYRDSERNADVERQLVTYMSNGTTAEELRKEASTRYRERAMQEYQTQLIMEMMSR